MKVMSRIRAKIVSQVGALKAPWNYLAAGTVAALLSVMIYAGIQYQFQKSSSSTTAQTSERLLDNQLQAAEKVDQKKADAGQSELKKTSESFRAVAKKVGPAVVSIKSTKGVAPKKGSPRIQKRGRGRVPQPPQEDDDEGFGGGDPFQEFFRHFGGPFGGGPYGGGPQPEMPQTSLGSGVIIDKKGIVVTNNHVVDGADSVVVVLPGDKGELKAKILGTDARSDLAVLKIEKSGDYPAADWADSDTSVDVGDWAIAIGSPFNLGQTVTVGIVSAKGRDPSALGTDIGGDLIQTDAAINPGNSGGPLCDLDGRVMGINTAIYTRSGGYMGIGFAIPSNTVRDTVDKLIKFGKVTRGWLGVQIQPLDSDATTDLGITSGVGIHEVLKDSPAAKAGLKADDVILEVDGKSVKTVGELQRKIGNFKPGDSVKVKVISYSDKKTRTVTVNIGKLPDDESKLAGGGGGGEEADTDFDRLGLKVAQTGSTVAIQAIQPGSMAEHLSLEVGDVIAKVNREAIDSVKKYKNAVKKGKRMSLYVVRRGRELFYQFTLPE